MPSGKIHDSIAVVSIVPVIFLGGIFLNNPIQIALFTISAAFSQLMFGPDLDLNSTQYKRWGIFRHIWFPYRKFFGHRSRFSHGLLFGPILRCIYLLASIIIIITVSNWLTNWLWDINIIKYFLPVIRLAIKYLLFTDISYYLFAVLTGLFTGAAIHTFTDKIVSFFVNLI